MTIDEPKEPRGRRLAWATALVAVATVAGLAVGTVAAMVIMLGQNPSLATLAFMGIPITGAVAAPLTAVAWVLTVRRRAPVERLRRDVLVAGVGALVACVVAWVLAP